MYGYGYKYGLRSSLGGGTPTPSAGSYVPLSWGGNTSRFVSGIALTTPNTGNTITRDSGTQFNDVTLESDQTISQGTAFTLSGDLIPGNTDAWYSVGQEGLHHPGITFSDLEFALRADNATTTTTWSWWESGSSTALGTTTGGQINSWVIEYDGANGFSININDGEITHTATSSYTTENLAIYLLGRDSGGSLGNHIAIKTVAQPNEVMIGMGDSITFGGAAVGGYSSADGSHYLFKTAAYTNHKVFANPILAASGKTSAQVLSEQSPRLPDFIGGAYSKKIVVLMAGINDLRIARSAALINADLDSIVSSAQTDGATVVICTVIRDHSAADYPGRATVNTHITTGGTGADYVCDLTGTALETDSGLFEDGLHPTPAGMTVIAENLWTIINSI